MSAISAIPQLPFLALVEWSMMLGMSTIGAVIIGDEILTGKVRDANSVVLIETMYRLGVTLRRLVTIGDDLEEICREVRFASERCDHVITSGGVGPTHDDVTMAGIAKAFDCPLVRHPALEKILKEHFGARINAAALKMAEVPEGAGLLDHGRFPTVTFRNIYILPGVPELFRERVERLALLHRGVPLRVARVFLGVFESDIAAQLSQVVSEHSEVKIGSYPRLDSADHRVMVTLESRDADLVREATERLLALLPSGSVLRVEPVEDD